MRRLVVGRPIVERLSWTVVDQGISSLGNLSISVVAAHGLHAEDFGAFAIAIAVYGLALGVSRSFCSHPLAIYKSGRPRDEVRAHVAGSMSAGLVLGAALGVLVIAIGAGVSQSRAPLVALGAMLPLLTVQDALRVGYIIEGVPRRAAANDLVWTVAALAGAAYASREPWDSATVLIIIWGLGAGLAIVYGLLTGASFVQLGQGVRHLYGYGRAGILLSVDFFAAAGILQLLPVIVAVFASLKEAGTFRAGQVLFGFVSFALIGLRLGLVPETVKLLEKGDSRRASRLLRMVSLVCVACAVLTAVAAKILPSSLGSAFLGLRWDDATSVAVPFAALYGSTALLLGPQVLLRANANMAGSVVRRLTTAPLYLIGGILGAMIAGAGGAATGFAVMSVLSLPVWTRDSWIIRRGECEPSNARRFGGGLLRLGFSEWRSSPVAVRGVFQTRQERDN